jgi:hypothetical protein
MWNDIGLNHVQNVVSEGFPRALREVHHDNAEAKE